MALKQAGKTVLLCSHILPEVEQICDRVVIIDRGRLVRTGRLDEILRSGTRVEIVVDRLADEAAQAAGNCSAEIHPSPEGVRLLVEASRKRELIEALWASGC